MKYSVMYMKKTSKKIKRKGGGENEVKNPILASELQLSEAASDSETPIPEVQVSEAPVTEAPIPEAQVPETTAPSTTSVSNTQYVTPVPATTESTIVTPKTFANYSQYVNFLSSTGMICQINIDEGIEAYQIKEVIPDQDLKSWLMTKGYKKVENDRAFIISYKQMI